MAERRTPNHLLALNSRLAFAEKPRGVFLGESAVDGAGAEAGKKEAPLVVVLEAFLWP